MKEKEVLSKVAQFVADRSSETSTKISALTGVVIAPVLLQHIGIATVAALAGDYWTCVANGVPVVIAGYGLIKVMITPDHKLGIKAKRGSPYAYC